MTEVELGSKKSTAYIKELPDHCDPAFAASTNAVIQVEEQMILEEKTISDLNEDGCAIKNQLMREGSRMRFSLTVRANRFLILKINAVQHSARFRSHQRLQRRLTRQSTG
jgi:hypothetical protein